jgi:thiamine pyrophosphate-dependent acetolactate synthase large subunit-like protein
MSERSGARIICDTIEQLGTDCVFGVPGTQTIELYEALRRSSLRTITATSELGAAFMAYGYARVSGRAGVLITIPGPGFVYAMPGLAEAFFDSVPLVHIVPEPAPMAGREAARRRIDQPGVAGPVVKAVYHVERAADLERALADAFRTAVSGEPGPVLVQAARHVLSGRHSGAHAARAEIPAARMRGIPPRAPAQDGPKFPDIAPPTAAAFFAALQEAMPADGILVTDSGRHQVLARAHFRAAPPRGFIVPGEFQSMGFGLPAAIGAKLAGPLRSVVALIGDGGFAISAMELLTAVRHHVPLTVVVFNDGALGQIRLEQITAYGVGHASSLLNPAFEEFAGALGIKYFRASGHAVDLLRRAIHCGGVSLVEVRLVESPSFYLRRAKALARKTGRRILRQLGNDG